MSQVSGPSRYGSKSSDEESLQEFMLIIKSQDGREHSFTINSKRKLRRLFAAYCKKVNLEYGTVQFLHDGTKLKSDKTPFEMGLENGDMIDAMLSQTGGGFGFCVNLC